MKKQLIILWIGIGMVVLAILFPPWIVSSGRVREFLGFGFLFCPPGTFASIDSSRLTAEILIIVLLAAGAFYTAKVFSSSIQITQKMRKVFKLMIAVAVGTGVVTFVGIISLEEHLPAQKAQPIPAPQANAQQAIRNQPAIPETLSWKLTLKDENGGTPLIAEKKALEDKEWQKFMEIEERKPKGTSSFFPLQSSNEVKNLHLPDNTLVYYQGVAYITHDQHGKRLKNGYGIRQGITSSNSPNGLGPYEWKLDLTIDDFPLTKDEDLQKFLKKERLNISDNPRGSFYNPYISIDEVKKEKLPNQSIVFIRKKDGKVIQAVTSTNSPSGIEIRGW